MTDLATAATIDTPPRTERSPGVKLAITVLVAVELMVPLLMVYGLVWDRQQQAETVQAAIIGLLSAYSAAVLKSWKRARFLAALLTGLYALLYVLLNLEAYSLLIGSALMFFALAGVIYMTRNIDWSGLGKREVAV